MYDDTFARTTRHRLLFADAVAGLDPSRWRAATLCEGWNVHTLTAHLLMPMKVGIGRLFLVALRHRGDTDRAVDAVTRRLARRPTADLIDTLRAEAGHRSSPARVGPTGPYADICLHLRDLARPLDLDVDVPLEDWRRVLDYVNSPSVAPAFVPAGRPHGVSLRASDQDWRSGEGPEVTGPSEALAMALTGRRVALDDLRGPGLLQLRDTLAPDRESPAEGPT